MMERRADKGLATCVACRVPMYTWREYQDTWWIDDVRPREERLVLQAETVHCPLCAVSINTVEERWQIVRAYVGAMRAA